MTDSIYRSLKNLSYREIKLRKESKPKYTSTFVWKFQLASMLMMVMSILSALIYALVKIELLKYISVYGLAITYLIYFSTPVVVLIENRNSIVNFLSNPMIDYFSNAEISSNLRLKYLNYLLKKSDVALKLTLNQVRDEKYNLENKISLMVGSIDKVGLTPGLIALAASWDKIENIKYDWVLVIAYTIPLLYAFSIFCYMTLYRLQSYIEFLELVIDEKRK